MERWQRYFTSPWLFAFHALWPVNLYVVAAVVLLVGTVLMAGLSSMASLFFLIGAMSAIASAQIHMLGHAFYQIHRDRFPDRP